MRPTGESENDSLDRAGFALPSAHAPWRRFVEQGDLGRVLVRMCLLGGRSVPLTFELERQISSGVRVRFGLGRARFTVTVEKALLEKGLVEHQAYTAVGALLRDLNRELARRRVRQRFIVHRASSGFRIVLTDLAIAARAAERDWIAALAIADGPSTKPSRRVDRPARGLRTPPALPSAEERVPEERQLVRDPSYASLLAEHTERLAAFANAGQLRCEPAAPAFHGDGYFSLKLTWTHESGGSLVETLRIRTRPQAELRPIFDAINRQLRALGRDHSLYRCTSRTGGEMALLATSKEAAVLRSAAQLIEGTIDDSTLQLLGDAGFALPYPGGTWKSFVHGDLTASCFGRCLARMCFLARPQRLSFTLSRDANGVTVRWRLDKKSAAYTYPADAPEVLPVLARVCQDLNQLLVVRHVDERFVIMTGESTWHQPRLLLLDPTWLDVVRDAHDTLLDCLPDGLIAARLPRAAYPKRVLDAPRARLPLVREIVDRRRVLESDFECRARPSDLASLVEEIADFAQLRVECNPNAALTRRYRLHVKFNGKQSIIELENEKRPDVRPILSYLNGLLAKLGKKRRVYQYIAGSFDSGVVLASYEEVRALRDSAYLVEGTATEAALAHAVAKGDVRTAVALLRVGDEHRAYDETLVRLGRLASTRVNVARVLAALGPGAVSHDLGAFVLAAWAEAGLPHAENLPPVPLSDAARGRTLSQVEARRVLSVWRDVLLQSPGATGGLVDLQWALVHANSWIAARRTFDFILARTDLDLSVYCNALYAAEKDNTGIAVDAAFDRRILERCLPFAEANPTIYNNAACVYAELEDRERVLAMLEKALAHGLRELVAEKHAVPQFAAYRDDPGFADLWLRAGVGG